MRRSHSSQMPVQSSHQPSIQARKRVATIASTILLLAIALLTFHAVSTLIFAVLGLAPSSPRWNFVPALGSVLAIAGLSAIAQTYRLPEPAQRIAGFASGAASGAILGFFYVGQLSGQQQTWAIAGAVLSSILCGSMAAWSSAKAAPSPIKRLTNVATVVMATPCAYGFAFGSGAWFFAAVSTGHWTIAMPLSLMTALYLWFSRRLLGKLSQYLKP